jgi:fido (protein-threonine AMPylation protein)
MEEKIIEYISNNPNCSSAEIHNSLAEYGSLRTIKRGLSKMLAEKIIEKKGSAKNTRYNIPKVFHLLKNIAIETYFEKDVDQREVKQKFNFEVIDSTLSSGSIFLSSELDLLNSYQQKFKENSNNLTSTEFNNEMERLAIDLSWKSSQIEGNTYSLLETEQLLKEKKTASGKTKDEAIMLLNHKEAIDFIVEQPNYLFPLSVQKIEDLHSILINELAISKNLRTRRVGISGTNYTPLDNEWQIKEALEAMCKLINEKESVFEKALLAILLISYIQPFMDGNKRTARIVGNSILMHFKYCPLSFRTVDSIDYKKAILLFYEVNNVSAFKKIFMEQYKFAVDTYF